MFSVRAKVKFTILEVDINQKIYCDRSVVSASRKFHPLDWKYKCAMTWAFQQCSMCDQQSLRSACAYVLSDQSLCLSLEYSMTPRLLTEQHLEFLSLTGGCTGTSESTLVKMPHCWKSHVAAEMSQTCWELRCQLYCFSITIQTRTTNRVR